VEVNVSQPKSEFGSPWNESESKTYGINAGLPVGAAKGFTAYGELTNTFFIPGLETTINPQTADQFLNSIDSKINEFVSVPEFMQKYKKELANSLYDAAYKLLVQQQILPPPLPEFVVTAKKPDSVETNCND
jgi:hypothetical protein